MLRTCSVTLATLVAGSDQLYPIRWYRCKPGALPYRNWTAFGHPAWEDREMPWSGPGVLLDPLQWRKCSYAAGGAGLAPDGTPDAFANGVTALGPLPSDLCGVPCIAASGGAALGGTGWTPFIEITSTACACSSADALVVLGPVITSSACACASPATAAIAGPTLTSSACACGSADALVVITIALTSSACACGTAATATAAGIAITSSACACGTASTSAVIPATNQPWWPSGSGTPIAGIPANPPLSMPYNSGSGTYEGTYDGGTLGWAGTASGSSPSGYWGLLTWTYGGTTYNATLSSYTGSSATGTWSFPAGTPGLSGSVTLLQGAGGGTSAPCACGTATTTTAAYGITHGDSSCPGGAALTFTLVVSGCTGDFSTLNGTWTLTYSGFGQQWMTGTTNPRWQMSIGQTTDSLGGVTAVGSDLSYQAPFTTAACMGSRTFTFSTAIGTGSHPATLTVTPGA